MTDKFSRTHGSTGTQPPDGKEFQEDERPDQGHFDWFWYNVHTKINSLIDDLKSNSDTHFAGSFNGSDVDARLDNAIAAADSGDTIVLEATREELQDDNDIHAPLDEVYVKDRTSDMDYNFQGHGNSTKINGTWTIQPARELSDVETYSHPDVSKDPQIQYTTNSRLENIEALNTDGIKPLDSDVDQAVLQDVIGDVEITDRCSGNPVGALITVTGEGAVINMTGSGVNELTFTSASANNTAVVSPQTDVTDNGTNNNIIGGDLSEIRSNSNIHYAGAFSGSDVDARLDNAIAAANDRDTIILETANKSAGEDYDASEVYTTDRTSDMEYNFVGHGYDTVINNTWRIDNQCSLSNVRLYDSSNFSGTPKIQYEAASRLENIHAIAGSVVPYDEGGGLIGDRTVLQNVYGSVEIGIECSGSPVGGDVTISESGSIVTMSAFDPNELTLTSNASNNTVIVSPNTTVTDNGTNNNIIGN